MVKLALHCDDLIIILGKQYSKMLNFHFLSIALGFQTVFPYIYRVNWYNLSKHGKGNGTIPTRHRCYVKTCKVKYNSKSKKPTKHHRFKYCITIVRNHRSIRAMFQLLGNEDYSAPVGQLSELPGLRCHSRLWGGLHTRCLLTKPVL